jgi:hypothetical protein
MTSLKSATNMLARVAFFLCIPHHDNELGDATHLHVVLHHISAQRDHVKSIKPSAVGIKEGYDVHGCNLRVKGLGVFQVIVPNFIDNIAEKFGHTLLGCLVTGVVIKLGFVSCLCTNANDCCGVVSNCCAVEWDNMVGFVLDGLSEDGCEGVNSIQLVLGDDHE